MSIAAHAPTTSSIGARAGFWTGLLLGVAVIIASESLASPGGLSGAAWRCLGVTIIVAIWWMSEALPLGATALLPAALFPLLGISSAKAIAPSYANSFILLLLGGFLLAMAVERSGVHRRLALYVLLAIGASPRRLVLGFTVAAAVLSLWISNTATALIMMPIALALADRAVERGGERAGSFAAAVLLGTAYGASVGGMGTPIGTPPNLIAIAAIDKAFPEGPGWTFLEWLVAAGPVVVLMTPLVWLVVTRVSLKVPADLELGAAKLIRDELHALGPWRAPEKRSLAVFAAAAVLWISREDVVLGQLTISGWSTLLGLGKAPDDATVALTAAVVAFMLPSGEADRSRLLPWSVAARAPWDLVLLFGGGIALAKGFDDTGLSAWMGGELATLGQTSTFLFVAVSTLAATFSTELVSNTALANLTMPVLAEAAKQAAIDPRLVLFPTCLACSCAFMLPAATGPNAIVFGTGRMRIVQMAKAGFVLNLLGWVVIVAYSFLVYG